MVLTMKALIDSSVFIENFKGNKKANFLLLKSIEFFEVYINSIIFSEVVYKVIGLKDNKSPLTLKSKGNIRKVLEEKDLIIYFDLILQFGVLDLNMEINKISIRLMNKYNLLPNDSLIIASCKYHNIKCLVSLDEDFKEPCVKEGIVLINAPEKFQEVIKEL